MKKTYIKYDINAACRAIMQEQLAGLGIDYELEELGEIVIKKKVPPAIFMTLQANLKRYGIDILDDQKSQLIQRIKNTIIDMVGRDKLPSSKISHYLAERLQMNYNYISAVFSEHTHTSIENYIILQKIERAKKLLLHDLSLTEISHLLSYSSVAHLSGQFKKMTGLSPSAFKKIISERKKIAHTN
ncbi:YesN/AraC family two-component response regulator [Flavobacterium gossypii]|uniref:YesN/AraC family two-component response regulator n=1 Tax=Flavobacterium gossypii TaxID=1646119 RepID=A0ABR6DP73_9FLAO|nr:helix-turn-helix domain-containing protein [Flavobacterium gossypii]MBA9073487.1 YesN/AraC family two-component response regulator [Flavobacterium gossypii]